MRRLAAAVIVGATLGATAGWIAAWVWCQVVAPWWDEVRR